MKDLISREHVIKVLVERHKFTTAEATELIEEVPSAEPKRPKTTETMMVDGEPTEIDPLSYEVGYSHGQSDRPTGEWVDYGDCEDICSVCGYSKVHEPNYPYCPNCGAGMRGEE